jgi:outer membrane protein assembly factor BamA
VGPVFLATRILYIGRIGRNADQFRNFIGNTELLRGNTSGSYRRHECVNSTDPNTDTGCADLDRLVGTQIGLGSAELRFPILNPSFGVPALLPPMEGAFFFDVGMAWDQSSTLKWSRDPGDDPVNVRTPMRTWGVSLRANLFGFAGCKLDYAIPLGRRGVGGLWTFSLGPPF